MCDLLIRAASRRVIAVQPDGYEWGSMESLEVWQADGGDAADWPRYLELVCAPGIAVSDGEQYLGCIFDADALLPEQRAQFDVLACATIPAWQLPMVLTRAD